MTKDSIQPGEQDQERQIARWWETEGQAMWDARIRLPEFLGEEASVIRFTRHGERHMPFVVAREVRAYGGTMISVTVGGLCGRIHELAPGEQHKEIATYSGGRILGRSLQEALYKLTH